VAGRFLLVVCDVDVDVCTCNVVWPVGLCVGLLRKSCISFFSYFAILARTNSSLSALVEVGRCTQLCGTGDIVKGRNVSYMTTLKQITYLYRGEGIAIVTSRFSFFYFVPIYSYSPRRSFFVYP